MTALLVMTMSGCGSKTAKEHPYDYYVDCLIKQQAESLAEEPFVEGIFPFTLLILQRPDTSDAVNGQTAYLAAWSFDSLDVSSFSRIDLIEEDNLIISSPEKNPVIIDSSLAKAEGLSVGDRMYQPVQISDTPMEFTVAAIYRHQQEFAQYEAVVLINDQIVNVFGNQVEELGYTNAYIKAEDPDELKNYLETEFVPGLIVKDMTPEEISSFPREEAALYYRDYETQSSLMK